MRIKNIYSVKHKPYPKALGDPHYGVSGRGRGEPNPCGAYFHDGTDWPESSNKFNNDCIDASNPVHVGIQGGGTNNGQGRGFCCDMFGRIGVTSLWDYGISYKQGALVFAGKGRCKGCPIQVWSSHTSDAGTLVTCYGNTPCRQCVVMESVWHNYWSKCGFGPEEINAGCTNPSSYGIITDYVITQAATGNVGSPNGTCLENCMQLEPDYYNNTQVIMGSGSIPSEVEDSGFRRENQYDCELPQSGQIRSGPKLIFAGGGWASGTSPAGYSLTQGGYYRPSGWVDTDIVSTTLVGGGWYGYLHDTWVTNNDYGKLQAGQAASNSSPNLFRRKTSFNIIGTTADQEGSDACCTYVSFGCTDPQFGSYDSQAKLNCDGRLKNSQYVIDNNGIKTCYDYGVDPNNPGSAVNHADAVGDFCYDGNIKCGRCLDTSGFPGTNPNYGEYIDELDFSGTPPQWTNPDNNEICYKKDWLACGGFDGHLESQAWTRMNSYKPSSWLYPSTDFWDKGGRRYGSTNAYGTMWDSTERPICQCNNQGCMNPDASNYSTLNVKDCKGLVPGSDPVLSPLDYGDETCCTKIMYGCPDDSKPNYFCSVDVLTPFGVPDNQDYCMDPANGIPCDQTTCPSDGGIPLASSYPGGGTPGTNIQNLNVQIMDDGSCDVVLIAGCLDDGGFAVGGKWPAPIYPGFSALNFNSGATVHTQYLCIYAPGCPDPLAANSGTTCDGLTYAEKVIQINYLLPVGQGGGCTDINPSTGLPQCEDAPSQPITEAFVANNIIPRADCCDFRLAGAGPGCTDPSALNFNPQATEDDGSCVYAEEGCTDPSALNFNPLATIDDGSCIYSIDFPEEGTNFLDGTEIELCMEPLTKEEVLMNVCQPTEIQSEVFMERGKQSVFEPNQRLGEVNTIGGLEIYGYGFYNIKRQI